MGGIGDMNGGRGLSRSQAGSLRWTAGWMRQAQCIPVVGTPVLGRTFIPTAGPEATVASVPPRSQEPESARRGAVTQAMPSPDPGLSQSDRTGCEDQSHKVELVGALIQHTLSP